jgi:predicted nucleotidyltransferase
MNGVRIRFLNRNDILPRLAAVARELLRSRVDVMEVSLFGSLVRGNYAPGSDADIFILLRDDSRRITDRIPEFLDYFSKLGVPIEVFPYTLKEMEKMNEEGGFIKTIQKEKVVLSAR